MKLAHKHLMMAVVPVAVAGLVMILVTRYSVTRLLAEEVDDSARTELQLYADRMDGFFAARVAELEAIAERSPLRRSDLDAAIRHLREEEPSADRFVRLYLGRADGEFAYTSDGEELPVGNRPFMSHVARGDPVVSHVMRARDGSSIVLVTVPVRTAGGARVGTLAGTLRISELTRVVEEFQPRFRGVEALLDQDGTLLAATGPSSQAMREIGALAVSHVPEDGPCAASNADWLVYHASVGRPAWSLLLALSRSAVRERVEAATGALLPLLLVLLIGAAGAVGWVSRGVVVPLGRLLGAVRAFPERLGPLGHAANDEIGELGRAFDAMAEETLRSQAQREDAQRRLAATQRLESVGRLAGGVAHDFNNLLTVFQSCTELAHLAFDEDDPEEAREALDQIQASVERGRALTAQLLGLARQQPARRRSVDLASQLSRLMPMLRHLVSDSIRLSVESAEPVQACVDPSHYEQILLNLVANARDAMPSGGVIRFRTGSMSLREPDGDLVAGEYAFVSVEDAGAGIPPEVLPHIFEPFYTTKGEGEGTGLGLASCLSLARQNGGTVTVQSRPGSTTLCLLIPRSADTELLVPAPDPDDISLVGEETLLLVEDERAVRRSLAHGLRYLGYRVLEAEDGAEAIQHMSAHAGRIDLLVSDVVLSGERGPDVAKRVLEHAPDARVIFISGYAPDELHAQIDPGFELLRKPFSVEALARLVRRTLARR